MAQGDDSWENRSLAYLPPSVEWRFQTESPVFQEIVQSQGDDTHFREDERHGYRRENCPSGFAWIGAPAPPVFNDGDSIDCKNPSVCWRFGYDDPNFRCRAMNVPPCFHLKEEEFHEYHRKEGDYKSRCDTQKPCPVLPPPDCCGADTEDCCSPIPRACPPCLACVPPPVEPHCVQYGNTLGEREWHSVNKMNCTPEGLLSDENEVSQYERKVKTCEPCDLPQACCERAFRLPCSRMRPSDADNYSPEKLPCPEDLPPVYDYKEDSGECNKRETRGCGPFCGPGYTVNRPLCQPECIPCGYYYTEQQTQCHSKKVGEERPPLPEKPCPPDLPCPPRCVPPCPGSPPCGPNPCPTSCERPKIACSTVCPPPPTCPVSCPQPCPKPCPNPCEPCPPCPPCPRPCPPCPKPYPKPCPPCGPCPPACPPCGPCPSACLPCGPCPSACPPCGPCPPACPPCGPCPPSGPCPSACPPCGSCPPPCTPPCFPCGPCPPPCLPCGPYPPPCLPCGPCPAPCLPCGPCPKPCISYPCVPCPPRICIPCAPCLPCRPCSPPPPPCGPCFPCGPCLRPCSYSCPCPRPCPPKCPCPSKCPGPSPSPPKCPCPAPCPPRCPSPCPPPCPSPSLPSCPSPKSK